MLVLRRNEGERIKIGDDITITVIDVWRTQVRIGIDAPIEIPVHREEIYDAIQREREDDRNQSDD